MNLNQHIKELTEQKEQLEKEVKLLSDAQLSDQIQLYLVGDPNYRELAQNDPIVNSAYRESISLLFQKICAVLDLKSLQKHLLFVANRQSRFPLGKLVLSYSEIIDSSTILYRKLAGSSDGKNIELNVEDLFGSTIFLDYNAFRKSIYLVKSATKQSTSRAYRIAKQNKDLWEFLGDYNEQTLSLTKEEFTNALIKSTVAFKQTANDLCQYLDIKESIVSDPGKVATRLYKPWRTGKLQSHPLVITHRFKAQRAFHSYEEISQVASTPEEEFADLPQELTTFFDYLNKLHMEIQFQYTPYTGNEEDKSSHEKTSVDPNATPSSDETTDYNQLIQDLLKKE